MSGSRKQMRIVTVAEKRRRQFTAEDRRRALELIVAGVPRREVARATGCCSETLRLWKKEAEANGTIAVGAQPPSETSEKKARGNTPGVVTPASGDEGGKVEAPEAVVPASAPASATAEAARSSQLSPAEREAILRYKQRHPSMGPAQIRAQLKRFHGWRIAVRAIARVLREHGYKLEHRGSRPEGDEVPHRFEAPHRNAIWQLDFAELFLVGERRQLLIIEDDFSRFIVGHRLVAHPTSEVVVEVMQEAIRRHGKPESVYTDRGGAFLAWGDVCSFGTFLENELIDHHVGRAYHPQGRGKVEAVIHAVRRELWETTHFDSVEAAERGLANFFHDFNHRRAHMGIDGLTPADRFFGRFEQVREEVEARARHRPLGGDPLLVEERLPKGQVEVVRLMLVGDRLELRLLGHTSVLGTVRS